MATFVLHTVDVATIVIDVWSGTVAIQRQAFINRVPVCHRGCRALPVVLLAVEPRPALMRPGRPGRRIRS